MSLIATEENIEILVEELLNISGALSVNDMIQEYESGIIRESTLFMWCKFYDDNYGTHYQKEVEERIERKLNPRGKYVV